VRSALVLGAVLLAGCATRHDRVVLLPDASGKVGKIAVLGKDGETVLDQPYAAARTDNLGGVEAQALTRDEVHQRYAAELAALPPRPVSFNLYFKDDSDQLTPQSAERIREIAAEIARRPAAELVVIGHTDTRADQAYNDQLSLARANSVRQLLIGMGFDGSRISTAGRGEREPAIATEDDVAEPRNRRAEVNVR
jgi:outer membrane protein OmpA-like peptidoglycan-associated protein